MLYSLKNNLFPFQYRVCLKKPHPRQEAVLRSQAKYKVIRAGRRAGKTTGAAIAAIRAFLAGKRVLYAAPTSEQIGMFWREVKTALADLIESGVFYKNESEHVIERSGTDQRIKAKTAWNADTLTRRLRRSADSRRMATDGRDSLGGCGSADAAR